MPTLERDIRCSWNPKLFHDPPDGNDLQPFDVKIKIAVYGYDGVFYPVHVSTSWMIFPSAIGSQDGGVQLGTYEVTIDAGWWGWVLFNVVIEDPPVTNNDPPPSEIDVFYGDQGGGGAGGYNQADQFDIEPGQELVDDCSLRKWHVVVPV